MLESYCKKIVVPAAVALLFIAGCGGGDASAPLTDEDGILGYVPADTAYVFAAAESMPDDVIDKLEASSDSLYSAYETLLSSALSDMAEDLEAQGDDEQAELALSLAREVVGLLQSDSLRAAGVPRGPQVAVYGVGLLPVVRIELSNPVAFEAKIAEFEASAGDNLAVGDVNGNAYRYLGDDDVRMIIAVIDNYAIATVVPSLLSEERLSEVLGLDKPSRNIAAAGTLATLAESYDFTAYGLGYLSFSRLIETFLDEPNSVDSELFASMGYEAADVSDVCRADLRTAVGWMPRIATGYTTVNASRVDSNTILELRRDIAQGMSLMTASVPGLGVDHGGLLSFGASFNAIATREFLEARFDAYEADPFECEEFANLQITIDEMRMAMNQPVPPIAYSFKGFLGVIDRIEGLDFTGQQPPTDVDARFLIANDNAPALLAMGSMFSPELASLNLQPDGKPVALPVSQLAGFVEDAYIAMTETALAVSVGEGAPDRLTQLLESPASNPAPAMSMNLDGQRYYEFMSEAVRAGNAANGADDLPAELQSAASTVMTGIGDLVERISVDVLLTERGIEVPASVTLLD